MNLEGIRRAAEARMTDRRSHPWKEMNNKYDHGLRVAKLAIALREQVAPGDNSHDEALTAAAWLHDIENGQHDHARLGAETVRSFLHNFADPSEVEAVCAIIAVHDDRDHAKKYPMAVRVHQDADHLDHFGSYDVWMNCIYAPTHNLTLGQQLDYMRNELPKDYENDRLELNYALSRRIFDEKADYFWRFTERLRVEAAGEIWDFKRLIGEARWEEP